MNSKRTGKQCRERYMNHLMPGIHKAEWTSAEDIIIFEKRDLFGNQWKKIAQFLPGRSGIFLLSHQWYFLIQKVNVFILENAVKNRCRFLIRKINSSTSDSPNEDMPMKDGCDDQNQNPNYESDSDSLNSVTLLDAYSRQYYHLQHNQHHHRPMNSQDSFPLDEINKMENIPSTDEDSNNSTVSASIENGKDDDDNGSYPSWINLFKEYDESIRPGQPPLPSPSHAPQQLSCPTNLTVGGAAPYSSMYPACPLPTPFSPSSHDMTSLSSAPNAYLLPSQQQQVLPLLPSMAIPPWSSFSLHIDEPIAIATQQIPVAFCADASLPTSPCFRLHDHPVVSNEDKAHLPSANKERADSSPLSSVSNSGGATHSIPCPNPPFTPPVEKLQG